MENHLFTDFEEYGVNVRDFGACGDGISDDSGAIQRALDAGQELVVIPYGIYKIGQTLRLHSNTHLKIHPSAQLFLADGAGLNAHSFLLANYDPEHGNENIHVEGGIWDGKNQVNPRGPNAPDSYTGVLMNFIKVSNLTLRHLTVRDAESYFIRLGEARDFTVEHIRFEAPHLRPNQNGVHLGGCCQDGLIRHLTAVGEGTTNDDLVALVADDALFRAQNLGLKCGQIRRVCVEGFRADSCHSFVRLLSVHSPIEDISIEDIQGGCRHCAFNLDACRECRVPLFEPEDPQFQNGAGDIKHVRIQDVNVYKASDNKTVPLIDLRTNVHELSIQDFTRDWKRDTQPDAPTLTLSDIRASRVVLNGITPAQLERMRQTSEIHAQTVRRLASVYDDIHYQGEFVITQMKKLSLMDRGFTRLSIQREKYAEPQ